MRHKLVKEAKGYVKCVRGVNNDWIRLGYFWKESIPHPDPKRARALKKAGEDPVLWVDKWKPKYYEWKTTMFQYQINNSGFWRSKVALVPIKIE